VALSGAIVFSGRATAVWKRSAGLIIKFGPFGLQEGAAALSAARRHG
jgi:hypothetical protein